MHLPLFRIFYSTTFTILTLILIVLLLITPADTIYQAYNNHQFYYLSVIGGAYLLTLLSAIVIYASRLYANRSVLAGIPKTWIPVEEGDVGKKVRRMILEGLQRSASIAYDARPRNMRQEEPSETSSGLPIDRRVDTSRNEIRHTRQYSTPPQTKPSWGPITHPGWTSPSSLDLPNLHFEPVILELPHLIEAKAVSLAPPDSAFLPEPGSTDGPAPVIIPDARVVELIQRPATMGLRDYLSYLATLNLINPLHLGAEFLALYEQARFSGSPLTETEFRALMGVFAKILRGMKEIDQAILADLLANNEEGLSHDPDHVSNSSSAMDEEDVDSELKTFEDRSRSGSEGTIRTAPSFLTNQRRATSNKSMATPGLPHKPSETSLKRIRTAGSSTTSTRSTSSVIRLAEARGPLDLPYTITIQPNDGT